MRSIVNGDKRGKLCWCEHNLSLMYQQCQQELWIGILLFPDLTLNPSQLSEGSEPIQIQVQIQISSTVGGSELS